MAAPRGAFIPAKEGLRSSLLSDMRSFAPAYASGDG